VIAASKVNKFDIVPTQQFDQKGHTNFVENNGVDKFWVSSYLDTLVESLLIIRYHKKREKKWPSPWNPY
jgi:hypothetical protein